jgi:hypothetical protein
MLHHAKHLPLRLVPVAQAPLESTIEIEAIKCFTHTFRREQVDTILSVVVPPARAIPNRVIVAIIVGAGR